MSKKKNLFFAGLILVIILGGFVMATVSWLEGMDAYDNLKNSTEDLENPFTYDFSQNVSSSEGDLPLRYAFGDDSNISTTMYGKESYSFFQDWIQINSTTGIFSINSSNDTRTGSFNVTFDVFNSENEQSAGARTFNFIINATNDAPNFTNIESNYTLVQTEAFLEYVNASDEEEHYPLIFNITFFNNCTHANWSERNTGENCSIMDFTYIGNTSSKLNLTPARNDVGTYWANITVTDAGELSSCPHSFCDNSTYEQNQTYQYTSVVVFEILSTLEVNATNCMNKIFQEDELGWCIINITTKGEIDDLNISSYAILRNYAAGQSDVVNTSWFYANSTQTASGFIKTINVSVTPDKTEVGNWTINFTVNDTTYDQQVTEQIYVYVNRSSNDVPDLTDLSNVTTSANLETTISLEVYDDDLLVPDKNSVYGGFNETITFTLNVTNLTTSVEETIDNFDVDILFMPVSGTNKTTAQIVFTPDSNEAGDYKINITVEDEDGAVDYESFNLTILDNIAPIWTTPLSTNFTIYEDANLYLNFSQNVSDADGDALTFSYVFTDGNSFPGFVSSFTNATGILDLTPTDVDVGQHLVNITVSDGYLTNTTAFNFTILNVNDAPSVKHMDTTNATPTSNILSGGSVNVTEDNSTVFYLYVDDNDFKIPTAQKSFYNENLSFVLTIEGINTSLFNFSVHDEWPLPDSNRTMFSASFTPGKADLGEYNVTVNFTDLGGNYSVFTFNLTIYEIEHDPVLSSFTNYSTAVNRTFYYDINVTDTEDGNDTSGSLNTNFTFSYTNLSGDDIFSSYFNTTTGIFNFTFNDSHEGKYHLNVSVNDSGNLSDYGDFWIYVYGPPELFSPSAGYTFNLTENVLSVLNFTFNHSVADNLTYLFYIDSMSYDGSNFNYGNLVLRRNVSLVGDGTSVNWSFTPNLTDETYGGLKNLTLIVYPSSSDLVNTTLVNTTTNFKLNISHNNSVVSFTDNIDDAGPTSYNDDITIDLTEHFSDDDYDDSYYDESITFMLTSNTSDITSSVSSNWLLTLSASTAVIGEIYIVASDGDSNVTSNNFTITFVAPTTSTSIESSSGGSSTKKVPVSLKILMPDPVSAYKKDRIELPLTLHNTGSQTLYGINLSGFVAFDGVFASDVKVSFSETYFKLLTPGSKENLTMIIDVDTEREGTFEITVYANVTSPDYNDWGKMYLTTKEGEDVIEKLLFTEEFIIENPECLELKEIVDEAKKLYDAGETTLAVQKADEAVSACKELIEQAGEGREKSVVEDLLYRYLIFATLGVFVIGIAFYSYKRIMLKRKRSSFLQQDINNKKYLEF